MKDFSGKSIQRYFYKAERGALTGTYGSGAVYTNYLDLTKGTYVVSVYCRSDTSVGNKLTTGDFQVRVQTNGGSSLIQSCHTGNAGYDLSFTMCGIINIDSLTPVCATIQTSSQNAVNGGVIIRFEAIKVS
jgi:hypothetical protein